jgi:glycosyltransferase involved in cell wall biosynthesis
MKFIFYSNVAFEEWDWRNSVEKGIGGSETSHVEMSWRLAARGHEVITYAPIPSDCPGKWRDTIWKRCEEVDWSQKGIWILYRCPEAIDNFPVERDEQTLWFMMQDWDYLSWNEERKAKLDLVITLCQAHGRDVIGKHPDLKDKLWLSSNGVKVDLIKKIEGEYLKNGGFPKRNPHKIIYASSPDRGLKHVVKSFSRAREYIPTLELHAFYGFDNLDKIDAPWAKKTAKETRKLLESPGVVWHGRATQEDLYKEWLSAGLWVYQTNFSETSCITCMEAQALGAIPIYNPIYALRENVRSGIPVEGDAYGDPLTQARFSAEIVRLATYPDLQEEIRIPMMREARKRFDWENFVTQWENKAAGKYYPLDFPVQLPGVQQEIEDELKEDEELYQPEEGQQISI